jgi:hypothetical protein
MAKEIFYSEYDGESLVDLGRDILECFDPRFNETVKEIPIDKYGIQEGTFKVTVTWEEDND